MVFEIGKGKEKEETKPAQNQNGNPTQPKARPAQSSLSLWPSSLFPRSAQHRTPWPSRCCAALLPGIFSSPRPRVTRLPLLLTRWARASATPRPTRRRPNSRVGTLSSPPGPLDTPRADDRAFPSFPVSDTSVPLSDPPSSPLRPSPTCPVQCSS